MYDKSIGTARREVAVADAPWLMVSYLMTLSFLGNGILCPESSGKEQEKEIVMEVKYDS